MRREDAEPQRCPGSKDGDVERLWEEEVSRRVAELDAGTVKTIPWSEVRASLLGRLDSGAPS